MIDGEPYCPSNSTSVCLSLTDIHVTSVKWRLTKCNAQEKHKEMKFCLFYTLTYLQQGSQDLPDKQLVH